MRILDGYILKRFIAILLFALISFVLIVLVVDLIGNLDKFLDRDVSILIILKYYILYIPYWVVLVLPIAMLLSSLFSVGQLARNNELIAMTAASIPLYRTLLPLFVFSILVSCTAFVFAEKIVPPANQEKSQIENEYIDKGKQYVKARISNIFWRDQSNRQIFIASYDTRSETAYKVSIQKYDGLQIDERVDAPRMIWQDSTWILLNGYKREFNGAKEVAVPFDSLRDAGINFTPKQLAETEVEPEDMSFEELTKFIAEVKRNGGNPVRWLVDLNLKLAIPFANFIMVLFGAPLASNKKRSGAIVGVFISLVICFVYFGLVKLTQTMGQNGTLSPVLAAWFSNGVFSVLGLFVLFSAQK